MDEENPASDTILPSLVRHDAVDREAFEDYAAEWEASGETVVPGAAARRGRSFDELRAA